MMLETRIFASPERTRQICNRALDTICHLFSDNSDNTELYRYLHEDVGMTGDEIRKAGFDCLPGDAESHHICIRDITITGADDSAGEFQESESYARRDSGGVIHMKADNGCFYPVSDLVYEEHFLFDSDEYLEENPS